MKALSRGFAGALVIALAMTGGCAKAVRGTAQPAAGVDAPVTSSIDPTGPEATWMNRWCGIGKLLITAGETNPVPPTSTDPAALKRTFVEATGRLVGVLDAVISDFKALRPAPEPDLDDPIGQIIDALSEARSAIATAKGDVEASEPMTVEVYSAAVDRFGTGMNGFEKALEVMNAMVIPDHLKDAGEFAPNCADR